MISPSTCKTEVRGRTVFVFCSLRDGEGHYELLPLLTVQPPSARLTLSWRGAKDPRRDRLGPTHSPMPQGSSASFAVSFFPPRFYSAAEPVADGYLFYLCAMSSQRRLVGGWQSSPWRGSSRKGPGECRAPFSPKSSNPWLNRELFPKPDGNRAVLQIWQRCLPLRLGNVGDVTHIPGTEE